MPACERLAGIGPATSRWQRLILPLDYSRKFLSAEAQTRTEIACSSDKCLDHLGYLGQLEVWLNGSANHQTPHRQFSLV